MQTCANGHKNPDDNEFCAECGVPLPQPQAVPTPANSAADPAAEPPRRVRSAQPAGFVFSRAQVIGTALVGGVVLLGLLIGLIVVSRSGSRATPQLPAAVVTRIVTVVVPAAPVAAVAAAPQETASSSPTVVPVVATPAPTLSPTPAPIPPSPTPTPTRPSTPVTPPTTDTPPGTILGVGDTWKQGGLELTLPAAKLQTGSSADTGVTVYFKVTNKRPTDIVTSYSQDIFSAVDNNGTRLELAHTYSVEGFYDLTRRDTKYADSFVFVAGSSILIPIGINGRVLILVDIVQPATTAIIVTVSGFSSITDARWRIPINH